MSSALRSVIGNKTMKKTTKITCWIGNTSMNVPKKAPSIAPKKVSSTSQDDVNFINTLALINSSAASNLATQRIRIHPAQPKATFKNQAVNHQIIHVRLILRTVPALQSKRLFVGHSNGKFLWS